MGGPPGTAAFINLIEQIEMADRGVSLQADGEGEEDGAGEADVGERQQQRDQPREHRGSPDAAMTLQTICKYIQSVCLLWIYCRQSEQQNCRQDVKKIEYRQCQHQVVKTFLGFGEDCDTPNVPNCPEDTDGYEENSLHNKVEHF